MRNRMDTLSKYEIRIYIDKRRKALNQEAIELMKIFGKILHNSE